MAQIFDWLGTAEPARLALCASLGGGTPRLRDVVYIKGNDWDNAVANVSIPVPDNDARQLTPWRADTWPCFVVSAYLVLDMVINRVGGGPGLS